MKRIALNIFVSLALLSSSAANASARMLDCSIGHQQGTATVEVLNVEGHPELSVYKLDMTTKLARSQNGAVPSDKTVHLAGNLVAEVSPTGGLFASGLAFTQPDSGAIVNPGSIVLQGNSQPGGGLSLRLYDSERMIQLGFGVGFSCH